MTGEKMKSFDLLKKRIEKTYRRRGVCQDSIHDWKGRQIENFQRDLSEAVGGYVSEKWFYTHLKVQKNAKLPRIDMLNLLSRYVGALSWDDFVAQNYSVAEMSEEKEGLKSTAETSAANIWMLIFGLIFIVAMMVFVSFFNKENNYRFCIVDFDDAKAVSHSTIQAFWLKEGESPLQLTVSPSGCVEMPVQPDEEITIEIQALYYKSRTIVRKVSDKKEEIIKLQKDDYALMIHYFSTNKMEDWNKRRDQLNSMLKDNARIVQVHSETGGGMALYNKEEFINKMTLPVKSLKNIEILKTKYEKEQIVEIRFVQKNN
jgi:hypothetical protein